MNKTKRRGLTSIKYQMGTIPTGEINESVNTITRVVDWFQLEIFHHPNSEGQLLRICGKQICVRERVVLRQGGGQDYGTMEWLHLVRGHSQSQQRTTALTHYLGTKIWGWKLCRRVKCIINWPTMEKKKGGRFFLISDVGFRLFLQHVRKIVVVDSHYFSRDCCCFDFLKFRNCCCCCCRSPTWKWYIWFSFCSNS